MDRPKRIFVCGYCVSLNNYRTELAGAVVVGTDNAWSQIVTLVDEEGAPYLNLAKATLQYPYEQSIEKRAAWTTEQIKKSRADGVIFLHNWGCNTQAAVARALSDVIKFDTGLPINLCHCGGPLLVRYDLKTIKQSVDKAVFKTRNKGLWRFEELLLINDKENIVTLGEGDTPLLKASVLGKKLGLENLYIKHEGLNLTGTFKSRGAAVDVEEDSILESIKLLAKTEGLLVCPEGATLVAALVKLLESGFIKKSEKVVLLNTGAGIKYPALIEADLPMIEIDSEIKVYPQNL